MIEVHALHKTYGPVIAVNNVSFRAENGSVTGILGPNGAGKSTSLRIISTLIRPDRGEARVDGFDCATDSVAARRCLGLMPDSRGLSPRLTPREHIAYFGKLNGLDDKTIADRTESLLSQLDLSAIADRRVDGFSNGERTKVALCRALIHDPQNVILDEPTNGLDVMSTRAVRSLIRSLRQRGRCVVFSSHVMQEVAALCDRIVVVAKGQVVAEGTPESLRALTGKDTFEEAFVHIIGSDEGLHACAFER